MISFVFYFLCLTAALSAIGIMVVENILHAALLLIACLLAVGGIFIVLQAEFLAVAQIMVYAGGVLVLLIFGIMITLRTTGQTPAVGRNNFVTGLLAGFALFGLLAFILSATNWPFTESGRDTLIRQWGMELVTYQAAPFELGGILLLISLIGAALAATYPGKSR